MSKKAVYQQELEKLTEIFTSVDESKRKLVEGLIEDAAFLKSENFVLRNTLSETGMVKIHPSNPSMQKPVEAAKQYLKNVNSYAVIIKTLNGILNKNILDDDEDLSDYE
ncbi:hypothetical protein [Caldibacillus thermoamylovorans]|uniref:hypothetical protein n=1 Tax=Caldibacillus thermoamylovorans TaxID=35841 RepID=UPI00203E32D4|nr:hypothetical protein [Caldibacillus thermoamylovorans]MCM3053679.1 hypothetical protein [Caldibacillus thermoamylovorans]